MASESTSYARIADRYEKVRGGGERADVYAPALSEWLPNTGRICDVGCGTRIITERLEVSDRRVVGCDISMEMLRQHHERLPGRRFRADAMALPFPDATLDGLSYMWVLHHVGDLTTALMEAGRVLRPGARLVAISGTPLPRDDDLGPVVDGLQERFRPGQLALGTRVGDVGVEVGLTLIHDDVVTSTALASPNEMAAAIEGGLYSFVWDVSVDEWANGVDPALEQLRSLPDPDRQREQVFRNPIVVLERPAG